MMCLSASSKKKIGIFFCILKINEERSRTGVRSGSGAGFFSKSYGSGDPDPQQNVTDPQHCLHDKAVAGILIVVFVFFFNFRFY
jgi:hypothetical protein